MNLFETIKAAVTVKEAAEYYWVKIDSGGMTCCPFHPDKTPSMKLNNNYYYCFGCHEHGDVIDLTARLFGLTAIGAARKLAYDFDISPDPAPAIAVKQMPPTQQKDDWYCADIMLDYERFLKKQIETYAPGDPDEEWDPRFCAACHKLPMVTAAVGDLFSLDPEERMETAAWLLEEGTIDRVQHFLSSRKGDANGRAAKEAAA